LIVDIIMAPKKVTKGVPKRVEKVNPTEPRPKIVVETVNSPELLMVDRFLDKNLMDSGIGRQESEHMATVRDVG
jgi:hypothetical protein